MASQALNPLSPPRSPSSLLRRAGSLIRVRLTPKEVDAGGGDPIRVPLGVEVLEVNAGVGGLRITAVHEGGLVAAWNAQRTYGLLGVEDRIVEVNGRTQDLTLVLFRAIALGGPVDIVAVPGRARRAMRPSAGVSRERQPDTDEEQGCNSQEHDVILPLKLHVRFTLPTASDIVECVIYDGCHMFKRTRDFLTFRDASSYRQRARERERQRERERDILGQGTGRQQRTRRDKQ